jgi:predicted dehydrogenase
MIHDIDLLLDLVGQPPLLCEATGISTMSGTIDHALATMHFANGLLLTVNASRVTEQKVRSIEVIAREAYVEGDLLSKSIDIHHSTIGEYQSNNQRGVKYRQEGYVERIHVPTSEPLFLEIQHFVDCVRNQSEPLVSVQQGVKTLELAMQIRQQINRQLNLTGQVQLALAPILEQQALTENALYAG